MTVAFEDGQAVKHVPYAHAAVSRNVRGLVTARLFMLAAVFLRWGDKSSLAEHQNMGLSKEQNLGVNVFFAFVFLIFGFHSLFWTWKKEADRPASIVVSDDSIILTFSPISGPLRTGIFHL